MLEPQGLCLGKGEGNSDGIPCSRIEGQQRCPHLHKVSKVFFFEIFLLLLLLIGSAGEQAEKESHQPLYPCAWACLTQMCLRAAIYLIRLSLGYSYLGLQLSSHKSPKNSLKSTFADSNLILLKLLNEPE